jgi:hypothetical protein
METSAKMEGLAIPSRQMSPPLNQRTVADGLWLRLLLESTLILLKLSLGKKRAAFDMCKSLPQLMEDRTTKIYHHISSGKDKIWRPPRHTLVEMVLQTASPIILVATTEIQVGDGLKMAQWE